MTHAAELAHALGGRRVGNGWVARCPVHDDRTPSLSICDTDDGRVLVRCHAGCGQSRVINALRARGLWQGSGRRNIRFTDHGLGRATKNRPNRDDAERTEAALRIWRSATPAAGTPVETYLRGRGICLPPPCTIRFHEGLSHPCGRIWPAMVALVTRGTDNASMAIHRTFLFNNGRGKASVEPGRMMLGPCRGGAVRLAPCGAVLMVGEGIETCLAAMQATEQPAWAALSTSGMRALDLPVVVREVIVLADGDAPGEAAAGEAALRWKREGRNVSIARPPWGLDFADMIVGRAPPAKTKRLI